jgi:hypothetical protein
LAAAQLQRWRNWKIFDESAISRMQEVELTSELVQFMLNGLRNKSQAALDKLYKDYDDSFDTRTEVERRFEYVMNLLESGIGGILPHDAFSKRPIFLAIFVVVYDHVFGEAPLSKKAKAVSLPTNFAVRASETAERMEHSSLPTAVAESMERRTTHLQSRRELTGFLKKSLFRA